MARLAEIETFVAVVEAGSLTAAAARLGVAISVVSRRVSELETRLNVRLANRTTRGLSPTPDGRAYYDRCVRLLADLAEADASVMSGEAAASGVVRIAAPAGFGGRWLGEPLAAFAADNPALRFEIEFSDRRIDLIEEGVDFAIRIGTLEDSALVARKLFDVRHLIAASPAFWRIHGRPTRPEDLEGLPALAYPLGAEPALWPFEAADGRKGAVRLALRFTAGNGAFLSSMARAGLGVSAEPDFILFDDVTSGALEIALTDVTWRKMAGYVVYPPGRPLPRRARRVIDRLASAFRPPPWALAGIA